MFVIDDWSRTNRSPVKRSYVYRRMKGFGVNNRSIEEAVNALIRKKYLRKAIGNRPVCYVQLGTVKRS